MSETPPAPPSAAPLFCRECRWHRYVSAGYRAPRTAHLCERAIEPNYDVVTGDPINRSEVRCYEERAAEHELCCGPTARFFEPRHAGAPE